MEAYSRGTRTQGGLLTNYSDMSHKERVSKDTKESSKEDLSHWKVLRTSVLSV